jgi:hypothetical protein
MGSAWQTASVVIFFISALFHELIVSIPFRNFKLLAFGGMMSQVRQDRPSRRLRSPERLQDKASHQVHVRQLKDPCSLECLTRPWGNESRSCEGQAVLVMKAVDIVDF